MTFSIKNFFSKCDQIRSFLQIKSHLQKKSLMESFIFCAMNAILEANHWCKQGRVAEPKLSLVEHLLKPETILMIDQWERPSDVCCLKMTVVNCSIYQKLLKVLVYKKDHHAKLDQIL